MKSTKDVIRRHQAFKEFLCDNYGEGIVLLEPEYYDEAIIGISDDERLVYSYDKLISAMIEYDGMSQEEAIDWISYNTIRSLPYMGEHAPIIMYPLDAILE